MGLQWLKKLAHPVCVLILIQSILGVTSVFYKLAVDDGMNMAILAFYRLVFGVLALAPLAYFTER